MATTRLGQFGVGVEPYAGFQAKIPGRSGVQITRLGQFGVGVERYAGFVAKTAAVEVPDEVPNQPAGGLRAASYRPQYIGQAYGVLPDLIGRARGVVGVVGAAAAVLPSITGSASGSVGEAGDVVANLAFKVRSHGDVGVTANAHVVIQFKAKGSAAHGVQGNAKAQLSIKGCANGRNDADDMTAIVATLMAA